MDVATLLLLVKIFTKRFRGNVGERFPRLGRRNSFPGWLAGWLAAGSGAAFP
jgi:hypothetical protein